MVGEPGRLHLISLSDISIDFGMPSALLGCRKVGIVGVIFRCDMALGLLSLRARVESMVTMDLFVGDKICAYDDCCR